MADTPDFWRDKRLFPRDGGMHVHVLMSPDLSPSCDLPYSRSTPPIWRPWYHERGRTSILEAR